MSKKVWEKPRPKGLGKPKPFNKSSTKYKSVKAKADKKFGKKPRQAIKLCCQQG